MTSSRYRGKVKWWDEMKGYGFITRDDNATDIFLHFSEIQSEGFKNVVEGEPVEFSIKPTQKGDQAGDVVSLAPSNKVEKLYDVAISFAGENREVAKQLAGLIHDEGRTIFYDEFEVANLWGKDLYQYLFEIYSRKARFCLIIISQDYVAKKWTKHELQAAQQKQFTNTTEYILPVRIDDTVLPGLPDTMAYLDLRQVSLKIIVAALKTKLGKHN